MLKEHLDSSENPTTGDVSMVAGGHTSTTICAGCCQCIEERYYLKAVDRLWHLSCLQCYQCKLPLHTQLSCYSRQGNIYCKEDYYRLFGIKRCARCQSAISSHELVMRARQDVYHVHCFTCVSCGILLAKGDYFGVFEGLIYCRLHYESLGSRDGYGPVELEPLSPAPFWNNGFANGLCPKGRPRKRKCEYTSEEAATDLTMMKIPPVIAGSPPVVPSIALGSSSMCVEMLHSSDMSSSMDSLAYDSSSTTSPPSVHPSSQASTHPHHQQQRTKRMRTSFKHHQLRTMKSYFNVNQNPDAKDLKQLAQKTGLSKRVLQVWFQNARAKWRRNLSRQEASQANGNNMNIIPLRTSTSNSNTNSHLMGESATHALHFEDLY